MRFRAYSTEFYYKYENQNFTGSFENKFINNLHEKSQHPREFTVKMIRLILLLDPVWSKFKAGAKRGNTNCSRSSLRALEKEKAKISQEIPQETLKTPPKTEEIAFMLKIYSIHITHTIFE